MRTSKSTSVFSLVEVWIFRTENDEVYQATRRTILSPENPYFYQGEYASGLGSSHTFYRYIWPIALSIQGLTATDKAEKKYLLDQLVACDGGTGVIHESRESDHLRGSFRA